MCTSIFNEVLGPVMRGPSSSHTAASWRMGLYARALLGEPVEEGRISFDSSGSYGEVYAQQGSDKAFLTGLLEWDMGDPRFFEVFSHAEEAGMSVTFEVLPLEGAEHPNDVDLWFRGVSGREILLRGRSIGGGAVVFLSFNGFSCTSFGKKYDLFLEVPAREVSSLEKILSRRFPRVSWNILRREEKALLGASFADNPLKTYEKEAFESLPGTLYLSSPLFFPLRGEPLFSSAEEMLALAEKENISLGDAGLRYESRVLGISEGEALGEMVERYRVMRRAVELGLSENPGKMRLLSPSAGTVYARDAAGSLPLGGILTRAAARALGALHVNSAMGVVCAAPTGGAAGVIPGVAVTLEKEWHLSEEQVAKALFAGGAVGLIVSLRATFAAEVAGCQAEIGVAGAMGAAMVAEAAGRPPREACNAAAVALQNTMGSVCDPVQGCVEIPCHTRNALAASSAFINADLIAGGYENPVPLDETVDACYASGKMLPPELRCTAKGGLAVCPSALAMKVRSL